ncbi:glycine cleavage system aminomethyltransferase GcvT [Geomicrobium sp. JSM 1781026]|uniref:glycine cleavage system aminomethyltransferase GcvT n=1 Tax=Geomicrobium sp. JSM 1781026 TaxID=3344580 RepID=UPI0035C12211
MADKRTALYETHVNAGAKMVPFGGWEMPVQYSSIKEEHRAVREHAGLFDVSHMGEAFVEGKGALETLQTVMTNDVSKLAVGKAQYSVMCNENGGTIDDLLVYRLGVERYFVVPNAANRDKDIQWIQKHANDKTVITDVSDDYSLLALQGPDAEQIAERIFGEAVKTLRFFEATERDFQEEPVIVSRSGYTGEDGFELYVKNSVVESLWNEILDTDIEGLRPCGLGARDTLRLEARLPLYGQELTDSISPLEAKLGFAVKVNKEAPFIGQSLLQKEKETGPKRLLVGVELTGKGIPRTDYPVYNTDGVEIGVVTSGTQSPTLGKNIGLMLIDRAYSEVGTAVVVGVRKRMVEGNVVATPFYKR